MSSNPPAPDPKDEPVTEEAPPHELSKLFALSRDLGEIERFPNLFEVLFNHLPGLVDYDAAAVLLQGDDQRTLFMDLRRPLSSAQQQQIVSHLEEGYRKMGGEEGIGELKLSLIGRCDDGTAPLEALRSHFLVPIFDSDREPRAILMVASETEDHFGKRELQLINLVAHQAATPLIRLEQLKERQQRLLAAIVENLPAGVVLLDAEGHVRLENPRARELLEILGASPDAARLTVIGDLELDGWLTVREPPGSRRRELTHKLSVTSDEEGDRFFELQAQPVPGSDPSSDSDWLLLIRDVTRKHREQELAVGQARQLALAQVTAGMAHEFNNLLTSIIGTAGLLEAEPLSEEGREDLQIVLSEGRRAAQLVRKLLDYARSSVVPHGPGDFSEVVAEAVREQRSELPPEYEVRLSLAEGRYPVARMNASQLRQMIGNAIENSVEAMPDEGAVELSLRRRPEPDPEAVLTIRDTGPGLNPQDQSKAFQPFFTTKGPGRSGLGLAQVQGIVREHGGEVTLEAEPDLGTTLTISLPLSEDVA